MQVKKLTDLDVRGKKVFIRADLNVPQDDAGNITEDTRIRASLPSIQYCLDNGAAVMVTSHLGRPTEGTVGPDDTLAPVAVRLGQLLHRPVRLVADWIEGGFALKPGSLQVSEVRAKSGHGDIRLNGYYQPNHQYATKLEGRVVLTATAASVAPVLRFSAVGAEA